MISRSEKIQLSRPKAWLRFLFGVVALSLLFGFFASGYSPPGICGEVLRHNQANDIDASPLLYSEVENMSELEEGVRQLRIQAKLRDSLSQQTEH
jgi:hypothetical protein